MFAATAAETFGELPEKVKACAAYCIELLRQHPEMYPMRRRALMRGYRYFVAGRYLVYYRLSAEEAMIAAIIPGAMNRA